MEALPPDSTHVSTNCQATFEKRSPSACIDAASLTLCTSQLLLTRTCLVHHILHTPKDPLARDWLLVLEHENIVLDFDRYTQSLRSIEIRDVANTSLSYAHVAFRCVRADVRVHRSCLVNRVRDAASV